MLRTIRLTLAIVFFAIITLLFLDFSGTLHGYMGWMAKIQFLPALLALNVGVVLLLVVLTLLFGRVYCSVICPLGVFQDVISRFAGKRKKNRFRYSPARKWLRYGMLALFFVTLVAGVRFHAVASLLEPYSSYGRIASNLFAPVYQWGNNLLAYLAERADSYAFYETEVWMKSLSTFIIAAITFIVLFILAWRGGRTYCNTICPVGTVLGFLSKYSLFKPVIDTTKCNGCGLCARNCKASCINSKAHEIDYSRCVACMDCLDKCKQGAITYTRRHKSHTHRTSAGEETASAQPVDDSRRAFLSATAILATTTALKAQEKKVDGVVDTTNIGAIFRSAAALGIDAVLLTPTSCDPLNRRAVRVSMGSVFLVPWTWLDGPLGKLNDLGFRTAAMALTDDSISIDDPILANEPKLAIVMGTEGDGLSHKTIAEADYVVRIPMSHGVDSLNVAAAAAVAFWQLRFPLSQP